MEDQIRLASEKVRVVCAFHPNNPRAALTIQTTRRERSHDPEDTLENQRCSVQHPFASGGWGDLIGVS